MRRISPTTFRIARRGTSREINRQIALNLIRSRQPVSRAELARLMGVRRGAVSRLIDELLAAGLIFEGAKGESPRGRKPMHLHIETRRRCVAAVDVSASHTALPLTDLLGRPLGNVTEFPTRRRPQMLVRDVAGALSRMLQANPEAGECGGVGVSVSGLVDATGHVEFSPTLGWRDVDLVEPLKVATKLPVVVENSTKACVLGQVWAVRGDAPVDGPVAFVNVSDGVGVGIAVDGKLLRGAHNVAGELGHVPLNMYGPRCSCGQRGCWEAYVSKRAVIARYRGTDPSWPESAVTASVTIEHIMARARAGEGQALETLRETGHFLGRGFATIVKAVDPRRIYVGGEITAVWDLLSATIAETLREDAVIREAGETEILTVALGEHPRLRGAAALIHTLAHRPQPAGLLHRELPLHGVRCTRAPGRVRGHPGRPPDTGGRVAAGQPPPAAPRPHRFPVDPRSTSRCTGGTPRTSRSGAASSCWSGASGTTTRSCPGRGRPRGARATPVPGGPRGPARLARSRRRASARSSSGNSRTRSTTPISSTESAATRPPSSGSATPSTRRRSSWRPSRRGTRPGSATCWGHPSRARRRSSRRTAPSTRASSSPTGAGASKPPNAGASGSLCPASPAGSGFWIDSRRLPCATASTFSPSRRPRATPIPVGRATTPR